MYPFSGAGVNPVKKKNKADTVICPGLDMGNLFKFARDQLFPEPAGGFRGAHKTQVENQKHAFAVLTDFGTHPLAKALEKSFQTVPCSLLHSTYTALAHFTPLHRGNTKDPFPSRFLCEMPRAQTASRS